MAIRIHDPIDCVTCWAGVDHDEPDAEQKAIRIINLRIGHRAIMAVDDPEAAVQIAREFLKRDAALEPRSLSSADIREAFTRNFKQSGVEPTSETFNQILRDLGFVTDEENVDGVKADQLETIEDESHHRTN
jgi:hypothetical protein